jgi:hypothetical protein
MKHSSNLMYNIGRIFTIVEIILGAILIPLGILLVVLNVVVEDFNYAGGATAMGYGIWLLVAGILCLVFVSKAKKELADENNQNKTPFIITIVFGAIAGNVFYVLAGIFGLIADGQQGNKQEPKQVEEPKEEPKE